MIFLSIPFFSDYIYFCQELAKHQLYEKLNFLENQKFQFNIEFFHGSFPYNYFNGDINSNFGTFLLYKQIYNFSQYNKIPIALDLSNKYIKKQDLSNTYVNLILDQLKDCGHALIINNLDLYNYINIKYPNYDFILKLDDDNQNNLKINDFYLFNNITNIFDNNIPNDKKQIIIKPKCICENIKICANLEEFNQYNYSNKTVYNNKICTNYNTYNNFFDIINSIKQYDVSYKHFKIDTPSKNNIMIFYHWLYFNLFKEEYANSLWNNIASKIITNE